MQKLKKNVSSSKRKNVKERTAQPNIVKRLDEIIKKNPKSKFFLIPPETLAKIYKSDMTIVSLVRNNLFHYEMLMALQQQVLCLEAKIKLLEAKLR